METQKMFSAFACHIKNGVCLLYTSKKVKKAEKTERPSVLAKLSQFKEMVKNAVVDRTCLLYTSCRQADEDGYRVR